MIRIMHVGILWFALAWSLTLHAANTEVSLLLSHSEAKPGETLFAAVRLKMNPGWHTYWVNGGDSGGPTVIDWDLPPGISFGELQWPVPNRFEEGGLVTYTYEKEVYLITPLHIAASLKPGKLVLKAKVRWLECATLCIPGRDEVEATILIGNSTKFTSHSTAIAQWQTGVPKPNLYLKADAVWLGAITNETRSLSIQFAGFLTTNQPDFYPGPNDKYTVSATSKFEPEGRIIKAVELLEGEWPTQIEGVAVFGHGADVQAFSVVLNLNKGIGPTASTTNPAPLSRSTRKSEATLFGVILLAFIGGLILNIMPCVLPVIALKILGFVQQSTQSPSHVRKLGFVYALGVWVSFLVLAGAVIIVKQVGGTAVWGMQFQNPIFLVVLTVLVTLVALNLFGIFEILLTGNALGAASQLSSKEGLMGAFFNGVLATALATPCTAPYLGFALGFAFTASYWVIIIVFSSIAFGLAAPYVLLSCNPNWLKFLPKPGAWMERFKQLMGFPMLATAVWLFSLSGSRYGSNGILWLGVFLVLVSLAAWIWGEFVQRNSKHSTIARIAAVIILLASYYFLLEGRLNWRHRTKPATQDQVGNNSSHFGFLKWSKEAVEEARKAGRPVLVDFTAEWCLTCQIFSKTSIENEVVQKRLKEINAAVFIADFTDQDPLIANEILSHGRAGVPLVLVYPQDRNRPPIILPENLTAKALLSALENDVKK